MNNNKLNFNTIDINKFKDIPYFKEWELLIPIHKGFSEDLKFKVQLIEKGKQPLLLKISDIKQYNEKKLEFKRIQAFNNVNLTESHCLNVVMSKVIDMGLCNGGQLVWTLLTYLPGEDFNDSLKLKNLSIDQQYQLGISAGKLLKLFHQIPVPLSNYFQDNVTPTLDQLPNRDKTERRFTIINSFESNYSKFKYENDTCVVNYLKNNFKRINDNPNLKLVLKHNDYHSGNMILIDNGDQSTTPILGIIDFNRSVFGYAYEEFQKLQSFTTKVSIPFSVGQIDGYFISEGQPTTEFWESMAVYVAHSCLSMVVWADSFGDSEVEKMKLICIRNLSDYNNFNSIIPNWYTNFKKNK